METKTLPNPAGIKPDTDTKAKRYVDLGILCIHKPKLYYDSILLLKYIKSNGPVASLKQQKISDGLVNNIIHIVEHQEISAKLFDELNYSDSLLMEQIIRRAKIINQLNYVRKKPDRQALKGEIVKRLTILQGSILAGSDSSEINNECLELLKKLYDFDGLTRDEYFTLKASFD
jgi:hypothetical protein